MLWLRLFSVRKNEYKMIDKFESAEKADDNVNGNIP
jgi:hypothetical protein